MREALRVTPSALVNFGHDQAAAAQARIMRRKTVSVTPAMGASTVAGAMSTSRMLSVDGEAIVWCDAGPLLAASPLRLHVSAPNNSKLASSPVSLAACGAASGPAGGFLGRARSSEAPSRPGVPRVARAAWTAGRGGAFHGRGPLSRPCATASTMRG